MSWMEFLRIRTGRNAENDFLKKAAEFEKEAEKSTGLASWQAFHHAAIGSDFLILLQWETHSTEPNGSLLACNLAGSLSELGVVDHSIWIRQE